MSSTNGTNGTKGPNDTAVADHLAIVEVAVAYCEALDRRRFDDLHRVFTGDARVDDGEVVCEGVAAVIERMCGPIARLDATMHTVSNHRVTVAGDTAVHSCHLHGQHVMTGTSGGDLYVVAGRYDDRLVRTAPGWRIAERTLTRVWADGNPAVVHPRSTGAASAGLRLAGGAVPLAGHLAAPAHLLAWVQTGS